MFDQKAYDKARYEANRPEMIASAMARQKDVREDRRRQLAVYKTSLGCATCGEKDHRCLDFHHKDPTTKLGTIGAMTGGSAEKLWAEVDKCAVVCANCHRKLHYKEDSDVAL